MPEPFRTLASVDNKFIKRWRKKGKPILGYACSYTPEEIIFAAEILPIRILGTLEPPKSADVYLPVNVCSFAKSCVSEALKGEYSLLDGYVTSNCCDSQNKIYDFWRNLTPVPKTYFINTPHSTTENALGFFCKELERFKDWITKNFETEITQENLKYAIETFNENRRLLKQVYDLRRRHPPLLSGSETLEIVLSSMIIPKDEHNKLLHGLLAQIDNCEHQEKDCARLLVSGSIMGSPKLLGLIESVGGCIVADDLCTGSRYFWTLVEEDTDPMMAIARRYLHKIPCPFLHSSEERFEHVSEMVKLFDVEGVIILSLKFCDVHSFDAPLLAEELRTTEGLPVLPLEWEHSLSGIAQLKTRVEAFIEMLEEE